ncbi:carbamoyltransferase HypF [mine drainage metagenome]|uniref:Carbamoyltransferase HypF n=1 Tax=mine drainage metagenome TaxID=410659 RepID=A0A1J5RDT4_9ZZZZ
MITVVVDETARRVRLRVRGTVQGVGFRPFVHQLAAAMQLDGFVRNDADGVLVEVQGRRLDAFIDALRRQAPPLARVDAVELEELASRPDAGFVILPSDPGATRTRIPPDVVTCDACLADLNDAQSRFYRYPFVSCTHCGPRYTITRRLPYDREHTSMAAFALCPECRADYANPASRRYHAESLACPRCGPRLSHSIDAIVALLRAGAIVALKGLGGFQLLCDARDDAAVRRLRQRKSRASKPFAVMVGSAAAAAALASRELEAIEREWLESRARPIVLLPYAGALAPAVAPGLAHLGVMLPCSALHHLLFADDGTLALVATSANPGGEPLVIDGADARRRLHGIADVVVDHAREIVVRADDSVVRAHAGGAVFLRRARGYVPEAIDLGADGPAVLAVGAHQKVTVTLTRGREAFVSQHLGTLDNAATLDFLEHSVRHLVALAGVRPERVACDLHPDLASTRWAERQGLEVVPVQHHVAHVAAVMAEHGLRAPLLGVALDGYGFGADGSAWGGELLAIGAGCWRRVGHLAGLPLPGGDRAARQPWRIALAVLQQLGLDDSRFADLDAASTLRRMLVRMCVPQSSALGRVFDAAAALLGICTVQDYDGQAAMQLEAAASSVPPCVPLPHGAGFTLAGGVLSLWPLLGALADPRLAPRDGAALLHATLACALDAWIAAAAAAHGLRVVALGGGCVANRRLVDDLLARLRARGLDVRVARRVPCGDGGLSLGQAHWAREAACAWQYPHASSSCCLATAPESASTAS